MNIVSNLTLVGKVLDVCIKTNSIMLSDEQSDFMVFFDKGKYISHYRQDDVVYIDCDIKGRFQKFKIRGKRITRLQRGRNE